MTTTVTESSFVHKHIALGERSIHIVEAGMHKRDSIVFLHGWPQDWTEWQRIMELASATHHVIAVDLPGVGGSSSIPGGEKIAMAQLIHEGIGTLKLGTYTLVGHDAGAMTAYAYLRAYPTELRAAVLMDSVIPGLEPWTKVLANPFLWHFAFHNTPELPELLVMGHQRRYFDHFFDLLTKDHGAIGSTARDHYAAAYGTAGALRAGFDWYRGFAKDAEVNRRQTTSIDTPVLYLRGEFEGGNMEEYVAGFHAAGLQSVTTARIPDSGHYSPEENPPAVWNEIGKFVVA